MSKTKTLMTKTEMPKTRELTASALSPEELWRRGGYTRRLQPDESGGYTASVQEFPGCIAEGESAEEALTHLGYAAAAWIAAQHELGQPIPQPLDYGALSGRIALRIPRGLHKQAAEVAAEEGVSLNQFLTSAISFVIGQKCLLNEVRREVSMLKPAFVVISASMQITAETRRPSLKKDDTVLTPVSFERIATY